MHHAADGRDHRPLAADAAWLRDLAPALRTYDGLLHLELFAEDEVRRGMAVLNQLNIPLTAERERINT